MYCALTGPDRNHLASRAPETPQGEKETERYVVDDKVRVSTEEWCKWCDPNRTAAKMWR